MYTLMYPGAAELKTSPVYKALVIAQNSKYFTTISEFSNSKVLHEFIIERSLNLQIQIDYVHFSPTKLALRRLMCIVNIMRDCPLSTSYSKFKINFNNSVSCLRLKFDVQEKN
jgi:hypothetical protein